MVFTDLRDQSLALPVENSVSVCRLFESQVKKQSATSAIEFMGQSWSYRTLNAHANQLAHYLREQGVGPDVLVGLYLERSFEMVVGVLAILKAGGAYVPLDPNYPSERLAWILQDSQVSVLLSQTSLSQSLPTHRAHVVCMDSINVTQLPTENPLPVTTTKNLAYVIYTSGSTGKPKGVMVEHGALSNFVQGANRDCGIKRADRVLQFASISFDTAVEEIFLTLTQGATLILRTSDMLQSVSGFLKTCEELKITVIDLPTAFWHQICAELTTTTIPNLLRLVIIGGERVLLNWLEVWKEHVKPEVRLVNGYGPTESTVVTTYCELIGPQATSIHNDTVPIGKPLPNVQTYILDNEMQPVGSGKAGELYIGGVCLARGYLNQPDLTNINFIEKAFTGSEQQRLYRTGDLVRCREDGHLEFLGRADHQEKIRGFRIELNEIETTLEQHPAVQEAIVIAREDDIGIKRLIAYIVQSSSERLPTTTLDTNQLEAELINQWRLINNSEQLNPTKNNWDDTFNISGWVNSYTGDLIADIEMKEWVDNTTSRILELNPQNVLEIGCGTGLLLFRIAPHCQSYLGIDISESSLNYIEQQLQSPQIHLPQVTLEHRVADNLQGIAPGSIDTVIINSVIQYFPSVDYLINVLEQTIKVIKPGGTLFLGDLRNYLLLEMFATSVEVAQAPDNLPTAELLKRIQRRLHQEEELTLDPKFFLALKKRIPEISHVQVLLKQGKFHNELTRFRYDVILHVNAEVMSTPGNIKTLDWQQQDYTVQKIKHYLADKTPVGLRLDNIPDRRLFEAVQALAWVKQSNCPDTITSLKKSLNTTCQSQAIDPEKLWQLSQEIPYHVYIDGLDSGPQGTFQATFIRYSSLKVRNSMHGLGTSQRPHTRTLPNPWHTYANNPLHSKITQDLRVQLRSYLKQQLPTYMLPAAFVFLNKFPLTANGKVNRKALPAPDLARPALEVEFLAPRTPLEESLAELWSKILEIHQIGVYDSFFDLGGDSLRVMQLFSLLKNRYAKEISFTDFFNKPTIDYLSKQLQSSESACTPTANERITLQKLRQEIVLGDVNTGLAKTFSGSPPAHWTKPQAILLTGATGFIGISLLHELLQRSDATIYCLIRTQSLTQAYQKLRYAAQRYLPGVAFSYSRIVPLIGDLARPILGLSTEQFHSIAEIVDTIYHSAANVNLLYPLSSLKAVNIIGTKSILKLAAHRKLKPVHFVSTLDVFEPLAATGVNVIYESDDIDQGDAITGGYAQSKWVAEKLVTAAAAQGIPTCIYRLGMVTGHSYTGIGNPEDLLSRLIKSLIQIGISPELNLQIDMTPVDYVSQAIVYLSTQLKSFNRAFHLVNPTAFHLEDLVETINQLGLPIQSASYNHWVTLLKNRSHALSPLCEVVTETIAHEQITRLEMWLSGTQLFNCNNTLTGLEGSAISCPNNNHTLLRKYLDNLSFR
ncbi:amino acid adenylation enzyme thioester reductase family protein [Leptolyngbya sp. Heron Island J]|uniref:amino acid adenylation domain-containing protein n=1 Tax=Leptolyngbya sp. Heron Island J TaxID=1385935 RepID=UPI0003B9DDEC|nr:amino acid adenylation domain-containing protein [Leptolyngbya sp. Heron Island J]ESA32706.1 amino acid adenylation enzyme thioester reductase family protein [Leptolyngbya sp. Heron Island J]